MSNAIIPAPRTAIVPRDAPEPRYDIIEAEYTLIHPRRSTIDDDEGDDYAAGASAADGCAFGLLWIVVCLAVVIFAVTAAWALGSAMIELTSELISYLYFW